VAVAVFVRDPVAELASVPATLNVAAAPGASETVVARMLPLPAPAPQEPVPLVIAQLQLTPVRAAGTVSATLAAETLEGPLFVTMRTYVTGEPGTAVALPSVFVTARSERGVRVSTSVALLSAGVGSVRPAGRVAVAVFDSDPAAPGATTPVTERVATAPGPRFNDVMIAFPLPDGAPQLPLPAPTAHVQVTLVRAAGTVSERLAPVTVEGPTFVTVTV
jgi:hypothetical protein